MTENGVGTWEEPVMDYILVVSSKGSEETCKKHCSIVNGTANSNFVSPDYSFESSPLIQPPYLK
jgi:hypothetical protein